MDVEVVWYERWRNPLQSPSELLDHLRTAERWCFQTHVPPDGQDADKSGSISKLELVAAMQSIWAIGRLGMELEMVAN